MTLSLLQSRPRSLAEHIRAEGLEERRVCGQDGRWATIKHRIGSPSPTRAVAPSRKNRRRRPKPEGLKSYPQYDRPFARHFERMAELGADRVDGSFTVVTYNVLAQSYTRPNYFPWAPSDVLSWDHRWKLLQRELAAHNGDLVCLQEVETAHYDQYHLPFMAGLQYQAVHLPRRRKADGCAIFYKPDRFELLHTNSVHLDDLTQVPALLKHTVVLATVLRCKKTELRLLLVTTHLFYKGSAKNTQVVQLGNIIQEMSKQFNVNQVVVTGDFNVTPESFVFEHMMELKLASAYTQPSLASTEPGVGAGAGAGAGVDPAQDAVVGSGAVDDGKSPPPQRGCTMMVQSNKMLDYVFYSGLVLEQRLSLPRRGDTLLPNTHLGSDHVSLKVWLRFPA